MNFSISYQAKSAEEFRALFEEFGATVCKVERQSNAADKGPNEQAFLAVYPATRIRATMIDSLGLHPTDREEQFAKLKSLFDDGKIIRLPSGRYKLADGQVEASGEDFSEIDPESCV